jgi:hypothetical protein
MARQLQDASRLGQQGVEALARLIGCQAGAIFRTLEWKNGLKLPSEIHSDFSRDLVGPVGDWRNEAQARGTAREARPLPIEQLGASSGDEPQDLPNPTTKLGGAPGRKALGTMTGYADAENDR